MKFYIAGLFLIAFALNVHARTFHRPVRQIEELWWLGGGTTTTTTTTTARPSAQSLERCLSKCLRTPQYDPQCGTDRQTYNNEGHLACAQFCGVQVEKLFRGSCVPLA